MPFRIHIILLLIVTLSSCQYPNCSDLGKIDRPVASSDSYGDSDFSKPHAYGILVEKAENGGIQEIDRLIIYYFNSSPVDFRNLTYWVDKSMQNGDQFAWVTLAHAQKIDKHTGYDDVKRTFNKYFSPSYNKDPAGAQGKIGNFIFFEEFCGITVTKKLTGTP